MSAGKRMVRGSALNLADQALRFAAVFIMTPIIVGSLGPERYGFWSLLMSILGHYAYLDFGLSISLSRFFGEAIGKGDKTRLHKLINTAMAVLLRIGGGGLVVTAIVYLAVPLFVDDPNTITTTRTIVLIYGAYLSLGFPVRAFRNLLKGQLRYDLLVLASAVQIIVANILIYYFLSAGYGLVALAIINAGAGFIEYAIVSFAGFKSLKGVPFRKSLYDRGLKKELFKYSRVAFVTNLGTGLRSSVDRIVLGSFGFITGITYYSVGIRFPVYLTDLVGAVMGGQLLVFLSQVYGKSGHDATVKRYLMAVRMSAVIAVFLGSAMMVYGEAFIMRWMGDGFGDSYRIMAILSVPYILQLMQYPSISLLYTLSKHRFIAMTMICGGVANLVLSIILVSFIGFFGVVWATLVEMTVVYSIVFPLLASRAGGIPLRKIYLNALGAPLAISLLFLVPFYFGVSGWITADYSRLVLLGVVQTLIFVPFAFRFVFTGDERAMLWSAIRRNKVKNEPSD